MSQWQLELKNAITNIEELLKLVNLDYNAFDQGFVTQLKSHKFPLLVTHSFVRRIKLSDPQDPLLLQILPNFSQSNGLNYSMDPLQEKDFNKIPGLIHKYYGRVLILITQACAIHCQYCFRQYFPYKNNLASTENLQQIVKYISNDPSIEEIILSGGDPLLVNNHYLKKLLDMLVNIDHVTTVRIHSRIPIVLPSRLEPNLLKLLTSYRFKVVIVTHANHPNEINQEVGKYIKQLHQTNITLLNQAVLLKDVNDHPEILAQLSKKLFALQILPYYLHTLDPVQGAENFAVEINKIQKIFTELSGKLPGYLVPRLVTEKPGAKSKLLFNVDY